MAENTEFAGIITFPDNSKTFEAYSRITNSPGAVDAAAIVERDEHGNWRVAESSDPSIGRGLAGGSLIGALVGLLGGPLGMLLGWATGAAIGGGVDSEKAGESDAVLSEFAAAVPVNGNGLIFQGDQGGSGTVEGIVGELGGHIIARPLNHVLDEVAAQAAAADAAAHAAREKLCAEHKAEHKEKWDQRWADIRSSLGGGRSDSQG